MEHADHSKKESIVTDISRQVSVQLAQYCCTVKLPVHISTQQTFLFDFKQSFPEIIGLNADMVQDIFRKSRR